ncbi:MAG: hypothetical protein KC420_07425 [Myxococcales bacterium]|nr:hypothetical protein [Myxococcales bacterium]
MKRTTATTTEQSDVNEPNAASEKVPFFARKIGRPALGVRTGVRAGAAEQTRKLD